MTIGEWQDGPIVKVRGTYHRATIDLTWEIVDGQLAADGVVPLFHRDYDLKVVGQGEASSSGFAGDPDYSNDEANKTAWWYARGSDWQTVSWTNGDTAHPVPYEQITPGMDSPFNRIGKLALLTNNNRQFGWRYQWLHNDPGGFAYGKQYYEIAAWFIPFGSNGATWSGTNFYVPPDVVVPDGSFLDYERGPVTFVEDVAMGPVTYVQNPDAADNYDEVIPVGFVHNYAFTFDRDANNGSGDYELTGTAWWPQQISYTADPTAIADNDRQVTVTPDGQTIIPMDWWNDLHLSGTYPPGDPASTNNNLDILFAPSELLSTKPPHPAHYGDTRNDPDMEAGGQAVVDTFTLDFTFRAPRYRLVSLDVTAPPVADFTWELDESGRLVHFDGSLSTSDYSIDSWLWEFHDTVVIPIEQPTDTAEVDHQFFARGPFDVTLTITSNGQTASVTKTVDLNDTAIDGDYDSDRNAFSGAA